MRGGDDDTVPVDLVEVDSPDALAWSPAGVEDVAEGPVGSAVRPARRHRRRSVLIAVGAAVVLAIAGTGLTLSVLDQRRADARWDALAARGLPLVHLDSPLEEAWRLDFAGYPMTVTGGVVVVQAWEPAATTSPWRGIDVGTGEVVWERTDIGGGGCMQWNPTWSERDMAYMGTGVSLSGDGEVPEPPTLLLCADAGFDGQMPAPGATATVDVVEITTGREVGGVVLHGSALSFDPVGDDVLVSSILEDGSVELARVPLAGGSPRWVVDTDVRAVDQDGIFVGPWPQVTDETVYLVSPEGAMLDARSVETGEPVAGRPDELQTSWGRQELPNGSVVEAFYPGMLGTSGPDAPDVPTVTVTGPDGEERFSVEGELWTPLFTDGSMADRIVVTRWGQGATSLAAVDVETGDELWTSRAPWSSTMLQADGVVVTGSAYLSAIDLRTGAELWERQTGVDTNLTPVTDGTRIAVPVAEEGSTSLVALDIRTGAEVWRAPVVSGIQFLVPVSGGLLVVTDSALVLYR